MTENSGNDRIIKKTSVPCVQKEVVSELSLPDYLPDISRLLRTGADVGSKNGYVSDRSIEYDGEINYTVIYATSDGRIKSVPLSAEFEGTLPMGETEGDAAVNLTVKTESVSCRLQNPRRLTVRTKICVGADVYTNESVEPTVTGKLSPDDEGRIMRRTLDAETMCRVAARDENVPISEDIELDAQSPSISEIISVTLTPYISEVKAEAGALSYKGDICAEVLYLSSSDDAQSQAEYFTFRRSIPISGDVDADGVTPDFVAFGTANVTGVEFRPQANAMGENRTVEVDFTYTADLFAFGNMPVCPVTDMYSIDYECENEVCEHTLCRVLRAGTFNFSTDGRLALDDKDYDTVVAEDAAVTVENVEKSGTKAVFSGKTDASVILTNGAGSYIGRSFSFPFKAETEVGRGAGELLCEAAPSVIGVTARIDDGEIKVEVEVGIAFSAFDCVPVTAVKKCGVSKDAPRRALSGSSIVICYPTESDTLWDIAKRYGTTETKIKEANSLSSEKLSGDAIIIPVEKKNKPIFKNI